MTANETKLIKALKKAKEEMSRINLEIPYYKAYRDYARNFLYSKELAACDELLKEVKPKGMPLPPGMG